MDTQIRHHSNTWDGAPPPSLRVLQCVRVCERERQRQRQTETEEREREREREREEYIRKKFIILIIPTLKTVAQN